MAVLGKAGGAPEDVVRVEEWLRVCEFCSESPARPASFAILGEAGAGKSTLWQAGVVAAQAVGQRLLRTEPSAAEADQSFTGLSDLLGSVLPEIAAAIPAPQLEALEVALLLRRAGDEPPVARAVSLGVLAALRAYLETGPVLVAVDDAQWLDEASVVALDFAFRRIADELPLSLLLAARTAAAADPLTFDSPAPSESWRALHTAFPTSNQVALAPLAADQLKRLLSPDVTPAQLREVTERARGNPFWAKEVYTTFELSERTVPPMAQALVERLRRSLTAEAQHALAVVAAAGRTRVPAALSALDDLEHPVAALDAAVAAGVLVESGGSVTVAHPLIGDAAIGALPPGRRQHLYQRLAARASGPERQAHFAALAAAPGPDAIVAAALDAAASSAHSRAGNAMAAHFASQAVNFTPPEEANALVARRIRAAELLFLGGDPRGCLEQLEVVEMDNLATPDLERAFPLLLDMTGLVRGGPRAAEIVARAVDTVGTEPRRRALVLALASDIEYGLRRGGRAAAEEAIICAEATGPGADPALHRALINLAQAKVAAGEGLDPGLIDRARALEASLPAVRLYDTADLNLGVWARYTDDLGTARKALGLSIDRAREAGDDLAFYIFQAYLAVTEVLAGNYGAAAAAISSADETAAWYDWPRTPFDVEPRCDLRIALDDLEGALALVDEHLPDNESAPLAARFIGACVRGRVSTWANKPERAVQQLERAAWCAEQCAWHDPGLRHRLDPLLAEAYVGTGRLPEALRISAWMRQVGERLHRPVLVGDACRVDALVAASRGDLGAASEFAKAAVAAHASAPMRLEEARSLLLLGQIERRRKARKDARAALLAALELARQTGHRRLQSQVELELPRVATARSGPELTATEQRVADLIAAGATNRDAAAVLFVSVRTVETHVASIYRKLGVRNRAELVRRVT